VKEEIIAFIEDVPKVTGQGQTGTTDGRREAAEGPSLDISVDTGQTRHPDILKFKITKDGSLRVYHRRCGKRLTTFKDIQEHTCLR
jgi:hypothetical protein